jgi:hypothetical protein
MIFEVTSAGKINLGTNVDLTLDGATAYISNPGGEIRSEVFGANASVNSNDAVAFGESAIASNRSTAIGQYQWVLVLAPRVPRWLLVRTPSQMAVQQPSESQRVRITRVV